jgi:S1-C subfamily serine protease
MFVRGKESSEELWSDVSHFPGEVPLTPPAPANKRALRDEEALMTKASNNQERSASPPKRLLIACVLAALVVAGCSADEKQAGGAKPVARVASEVEPSVVQVNVQAVQQTPSGLEEAQGLGSGVIYREDGYIITNNHVVEGANEVNVAFVDGSSEGGEVVGGDRSTDVAVVRVDREGLPAADFAENLSLRVGELAVALGSPSGFQSTVTAGVISGLGREVPPEFTGGQAQDPSLVDLIQTDAAISPAPPAAPWRTRTERSWA